MMSTQTVDVMTIARDPSVADEQIVSKVLAGDLDMFEVLMRRYNQRLFRMSRSILKNDADAEDVVQEAYVRAYTHLADFAGRSKFSTWLTKIALHEALSKRRRLQRFTVFPPHSGNGDDVERAVSGERDPEHEASNDELGKMLETAVDSLPDHYRSVFMLRQVEGLDTAETAACLGLSLEAVKTRFHRARSMLRNRLKARLGESTSQAFLFLGVRCNRIAEKVLSRLGEYHRNSCYPAASI